MSRAPAIRWAGPDDAEGILALNASVAHEAPEYLGQALDPVSGAEMLQAKLAAGLVGDGVLVSVTAGGVVGALTLRAHAHPAYAGVLQLGLCVAPRARREGVGLALTAAAISLSRAGGVRRLQLAVIDGNGAALSLFLKAGFAVEGRLRQAALVGGVARDVIAMGLGLASEP